MARRNDEREPVRPIEAVHAPGDDPTWERLEDQIGWYDRKSGDNQRWYKRLKLVELAIAATLPVVTGLRSPVWVTGGLAAVIVMLGTQHLYQFQEHWITYRSTTEALKHERYLFLANAGPTLRRRGSTQPAGRAQLADLASARAASNSRSRLACCRPGLDSRTRRWRHPWRPCAAA